MASDRYTRRTRREFLRLCLAMPTTFVLAACANQAAGSVTPPPVASQPTSAATQAQPAPTSAPTQPVIQAQPAATAPTQAPQAQALPPTPACDDGDDATLAQTEGPYYTPNTPERTSLLE